MGIIPIMLVEARIDPEIILTRGPILQGESHEISHLCQNLLLVIHMHIKTCLVNGRSVLRHTLLLNRKRNYI
jgi:hypothetical protein